MRKCAKDLKEGDICYVVSSNNEVSTCEVACVKDYSQTPLFKNIEIEFTNKCKGSCYAESQHSTYGNYAAIVFFDKEGAINYLEDRKKIIDKTIDILMSKN